MALTFENFIAPIKNEDFSELIIPTAQLAWITATTELKAEIAALATELSDFNNRLISRYGKIDEIADKMWQLSAV